MGKDDTGHKPFVSKVIIFVLFTYQFGTVLIKKKSMTSVQLTTKEGSGEPSVWNSKNYLGTMCITMVVGSCWGAFAAACLLSSGASTWLVGLTIGASMMNNVAAIAQIPYANLLKVFVGTTFVNGILLIYALLA